jgi:hypothetical protein
MLFGGNLDPLVSFGINNLCADRRREPARNDTDDVGGALVAFRAAGVFQIFLRPISTGNMHTLAVFKDRQKLFETSDGASDQVFFAKGVVDWPPLLCACLYAEIVVFGWLLSAFGFLASLLPFS